jgi:hypothetical protein
MAYLGAAAAFAIVLGIVFDRNIWKLYSAGGDLPGVLEGIFTILLTIIFAVISVYLLVHVLHPYFSKRQMPASLQRIISDENIVEDMSREELLGFVKDLASKDEDIKAYVKTIGVKSDIAVTLATSLVAFFLGMYGYMVSFTIGYDSEPNIISVTICFIFIIFSSVYMILKTMKVVWDV